MSVDTNNWANWTDQEWAEYLAGSSDLDDHSLAMRLRLVERLKQRQRLNPTEEELFQLLLARNAVELDYLKEVQRVGYAVTDGRPCWPRWHWGDELEELFCRSLTEGQGTSDGRRLPLLFQDEEPSADQ